MRSGQNVVGHLVSAAAIAVTSRGQGGRDRDHVDPHSPFTIWGQPHRSPRPHRGVNLHCECQGATAKAPVASSAAATSTAAVDRGIVATARGPPPLSSQPRWRPSTVTTAWGPRRVPWPCPRPPLPWPRPWPSTAAVRPRRGGQDQGLRGLLSLTVVVNQGGRGCDRGRRGVDLAWSLANKTTK